MVWKILQEGVRSSSKATKWVPEKKGRKCVEMLERALRRLGYDVTITPANQVADLGRISTEYNA